MPRARKYPEELLERGARLVFESRRPIAHVAADLGIHAQARRKRVRQAEADAGGRRELLTSSEREELAGLRREVKQLRKATEILNGLLGALMVRAACRRALEPDGTRGVPVVRAVAWDASEDPACLR